MWGLVGKNEALIASLQSVAGEFHTGVTAELGRSTVNCCSNSSICQLSLVQFNSRWYLCDRKSPCVPSALSLRGFPNVAFETVLSSVRLIDDGPLWTFEGSSLSSSSFHVSLLQSRLGFVLAGSVRNTSDLPRRKSLVMVALPTCLSACSFSFAPACPGRYIRSF